MIRVRRVLLTSALFLVPVEARADAATEAKLRDALRATTSQLRALEDEKARWQKTEADLRAELETVRAQPAAAKTSDPEKRAVASLNRRVNELTDANARLRASLGKCETATAPQPVPASSDEERKRLAGEVDGLRRELAGSQEKNQEMYRVSKELLAWLEKVGVGGEPFFGWKRNELENIAQDYGDKLLDQKVKKQ
jgi:phage shock protein A